MAAPLTLAQLLTAPTASQIFNNFLSVLSNTLGVPANNWRTGGVGRTFLQIVANLFASWAILIVQAIAGGFLGYATGGWLTLLAYYGYGVTRPAATQATGSETFTNTGGGSYSFAIGQVTLLNPITKQTYTNAQPLVLPPNSTATINIICTVAGSIGNAAPGAISSLVTTMLGVSVGNAAAVVGQDAMSDALLVQACIAKLGALSVRGPRGAYKYYALFTSAGTALLNSSGNPVNINRVSVSPSSHTGTVQVYIAGPQGAPTADDLATATTSILLNAVPSAVTCTVAGALPVPYVASLTIWAQALPGIQASVVAAPAAAALATYFANYPIGGLMKGTAQGVYATEVDGQVTSAHPAIFAVDGAVDLALVAGEVATDQITLTVRLVTPPS